MAYSIVGMVNGHGHNGQQIDVICDAHGPCQMIRSIFKPVFLPISTYLLYLQFSQMPRYPDLMILVTMTDRQTLIALPLAYERRVINYMTYIIGDELGLHYGGFCNSLGEVHYWRFCCECTQYTVHCKL